MIHQEGVPKIYCSPGENDITRFPHKNVCISLNIGDLDKYMQKFVRITGKGGFPVNQIRLMAPDKSLLMRR